MEAFRVALCFRDHQPLLLDLASSYGALVLRQIKVEHPIARIGRYYWLPFLRSEVHTMGQPLLMPEFNVVSRGPKVLSTPAKTTSTLKPL